MEREFITTNATDIFGAASITFLEAADASVPAMERSWLLHTAILPACMISPLWWRFLQNMRQTYDNKQRWPYLGNALKYFVAAQVAMVGVYQPNMQQSYIWLTSFVLATLYQVRRRCVASDEYWYETYCVRCDVSSILSQ